jgi:dCMP deaminase
VGVVRKDLNVRPTWDETWLRIALDVSRRSRCVRSQVGCVIVTSTNRVASISYNGPPRGLALTGMCDDWCPRAREGGAAAYYDNCVSSHAEPNGLGMSDRSVYEGGTMYVTRSPCYTCSKIIANSGLQRVVFPIAPEDAEREPMKSVTMMEASGLQVVVWDG